MAPATRNAQFHYRIYNGDDCYDLTRVYPVPAWLCSKTPAQAQDKNYHDTFLDTFNAANVKNHDDVMAKISHPCVKCGKAAKNAVKSPMVCLHLPEPMVIVMAMPSCGAQLCEGQLSNDMQGTIGQAYANRAAENGTGQQVGASGDSTCDVCGKPASNRCAGCGSAVYCNRACRKSAWRNHKSLCSMLTSKKTKETTASNEDVD